MKILHDISSPVFPGMVVYPGNPDVRFERRQGALSVHTELVLGTHTGTHVDAPAHVFPDGLAVDALPLDVFVGPCRVLDMCHVDPVVRMDDFVRANIIAGERILVKTKNSERTEGHFISDYVSLDGDAADYLAEIGIALFGIDYLSVKKRGGKDERPHTSLLTKNIPILEGLRLGSVPPGAYTLVALPLPLQGLDGSPVRAVLLET